LIEVPAPPAAGAHGVIDVFQERPVSTTDVGDVARLPGNRFGVEDFQQMVFGIPEVLLMLQSAGEDVHLPVALELNRRYVFHVIEPTVAVHLMQKQQP